MRILLTTFGPFRDIPKNITESVAQEIQTSWDNASGELVVLNLPVVWSEVEAALQQALEKLTPDIVISMGHAENYSAITVETRYVNLADGADNRGETREGGVICSGAENFYDANIDTDGLARYLTKNSIPAVLHAGKEGMTYLCNFAGYVVMRHIRNRRQEKPLFVFLHLPPDFSLSVLTQGVEQVINFLVSKTRP